MTVKYKIEVPNELSADFWKILTENFNIVLTKRQHSIDGEKINIVYDDDTGKVLELTDEEYEKIKEFLLLYMGLKLAIDDKSFLDGIVADGADEIRRQAHFLLGESGLDVNGVYDTYTTLGWGTDTFHSSVDYVTKDKNGENVTITFEFNLSSYANSDKISFAAVWWVPANSDSAVS